MLTSVLYLDKGLRVASQGGRLHTVAEEKMGPAEKVIFWYTEKPYEGGGLSRVYCMLQLSIERDVSDWKGH